MARETTLATIWLMLLKMFEIQGVDVERLMREIGLPPEALRQHDARLPSRLADLAFERAARLIDNPAFGLTGAQSWHPSNLGTLGYAWLSCVTLRRGLRRMERCARILGNRFSYTGFDQSDGFRFVYDHGRGDAEIGWYMADFTLSIIVDMCRTNVGQPFAPQRICLRRPLPQDASPYLAFFGGEVLFGQSEDSIFLDEATADAVLPTANRVMAATFDEILTGQLNELVADDLVTRCRAYLLQHLTSGEPVEADLATELGLSRRVMQRRLCDHGWSFKRLADDTRTELAKRYIADPRKSLTEIAFLLGYSEQSAFSRAFRRCVGASPTDYRRQLA